MAVTLVGVGGSVRGRLGPVGLAPASPSTGLFNCCSKGDSDNTGLGTLRTVVVTATGLVTVGGTVLLSVAGPTVRTVGVVVTVLAEAVAGTVLTVVVVDFTYDVVTGGRDATEVLAATTFVIPAEAAAGLTTLLTDLTVEETVTRAP